MDAPPSRAGSRFGPYELRSLLGRGGMGEVYEAYDTSKDRVVALKLLPSELAKDATYQERFRRESQAAARLAEPHIIPIHDWGEIDGVLYIDMRLVSGRDLRSLLDELGPLPPLRAIGIIEQIAAALDAAHYSGLVHRDVKPANILVTDADFAYLADFGIARAEGDSTITMTGTAIGSYAYMAPERFDAGPVSGRADIYSLACVLHECLTGEKPFPAHNVSVLVRAHLSEPPPATSMLRAGIPPQLDAVVAKALAKDPNDRFFTAGEFARAARMALAGGRPVPPPGEPPRPGRTVPPGPPVGAQPTTVMSPAAGPFGPPTTVLPGGSTPPPGEPPARNSDPTLRQPSPRLTTPTGSIPAYITGSFPATEDSSPSGDLPVIRPSDPTRVRVSDFHYTPLPADAHERAAWGHAQAQEFPYAPAPDDSLYPTAEHAVVYTDPPRTRQQRRRSVVLPVAIGVLVIAGAAVAGAVGWQVLDRSGNETPITTAAQGVPGTTSAPRSQSANPTVTTTAPTTVQLPTGATSCPSKYAALGGYTTSAIGNTVTTCPFAEEVRRAYADAAASRPGSAVSVVAVSPVTGRSYTMNCTAAGKLVTCVGGENAVVYVY
ncbi:serine/threonine-protein kinase [Nocardia sp. CDC160]|uniref:serine/threonine-protein kinase n=1 Tax=Nocardia sp. CDC160 TaxID=3112166 RepID=UPI002DB8BBA1|nr:protein kinase [Nocardia sp. CDC160]MEC3915163.1 protein kinase [Nocardia sp. CDC160]